MAGNLKLYLGPTSVPHHLTSWVTLLLARRQLFPLPHMNLCAPRLKISQLGDVLEALPMCENHAVMGKKAFLTLQLCEELGVSMPGPPAPKR